MRAKKAPRMKPTRRILCGTDFSPHAQGAADVAAAIALRLRATLELVHVTDEAHAFGESTKDFRLAMRRARAQLGREAARLRRGGAVVTPVLLHGEWAEYAIGDLLARNPPLLVVVSSVSKTAFDRWTLGSTSEHIAQHAPGPTLVVRASERLLAWARQERRLNVVVAVDFSTSSDAALAFVRELRKVGACAVTVAHINWPPDARKWAPGKGLPLTSEPPRVRRLLLRELRRKVDDFVEGAAAIRLEPNWGRPDAALVHLATEADADLIVVGTHQRHGTKRLAHASISRGVLRHAPMSVICVPVAAALAHGAGHHPRAQRVLVATDLSPAGDQAIPWAYATVAPGGVVKLVHVIKPWELPSPLVPRYEPKRGTHDAHHARLEQARDKLAALVPAAAALRGVETEVEIVDDRDPAHGIGVAVRRFGPDVICLSTGERPAIAKALFGSVVRDVIAQNTEPVLTVKPEKP
jgi:nucleotide-binding universal stress UspA family protein